MLLIEQALSEEINNYSTETVESSYTFNNRKVPRVTDILSKTIHEEYLMTWANSLGFKRIRYRDELNRAAAMGTRTHSAIEHFLKNKEISDNIGFQSFLLWWNDITANNTVEIVGEEEKLVCEYYGGTYDLLLRINARYFLVDFKTSNHVSFKYFLQTSAYRYMIYTNKQIVLDGVIILQLDKESESYEEYVLDFSIPEQYNFIESCFKTFLSLVYAYYNTEYIREEYKTLFPKT